MPDSLSCQSRQIHLPRLSVDVLVEQRGDVLVLEGSLAKSVSAGLRARPKTKR